MKSKYSFNERLEFCRNFCTETSKIAGVAKALKELSETSTDAQTRYYLKSLLECQFKQLMINLNILTLDKFSDIKVWDLIQEFNVNNKIDYSN